MQKQGVLNKSVISDGVLLVLLVPRGLKNMLQITVMWVLKIHVEHIMSTEILYLKFD